LLSTSRCCPTTSPYCATSLERPSQLTARRGPAGSAAAAASSRPREAHGTTGLGQRRPAGARPPADVRRRYPGGRYPGQPVRERRPWPARAGGRRRRSAAGCPCRPAASAVAGCARRPRRPRRSARPAPDRAAAALRCRPAATGPVRRRAPAVGGSPGWRPRRPECRPERPPPGSPSARQNTAATAGSDQPRPGFLGQHEQLIRGGAGRGWQGQRVRHLPGVGPAAGLDRAVRCCRPRVRWMGAVPVGQLDAVPVGQMVAASRRVDPAPGAFTRRARGACLEPTRRCRGRFRSPWSGPLEGGSRLAARPPASRRPAKDRLPTAYRWLADEATWPKVVNFLALEGGPDGGFDDLIALCQVRLAGSAKLELARELLGRNGRR